MTITIDQEDAAFFSWHTGVKIKDYQGNKQRKFKSKYEVKRFTADGQPLTTVRSLTTLRSASSSRLGQPHPVHGMATYLEAVKVLEEAEMAEGDSSDF